MLRGSFHEECFGRSKAEDWQKIGGRLILFFGFGHFEGVKLGTIFVALVNGSMIGLCSRLFEKGFAFEDKFPFRKYFEKNSRE